ncbi:MAG: hypothetical protein OXF89_13885 [Rhodospirillaceae bacterium]|nr:hypothetical protein [Rhodospirillaceae bacterium]
MKIDRILTCEDGQGGTRRIRQDEVAAIQQPLVILGDPGLGKTELAEALGLQPGLVWVRAGKFMRTADPSSLIADGERIVIDGIDEIASSGSGAAVASVLVRLSEMGRPPFILTCREADWLGAADRINIKDDYGAAPLLLRLQPFTRDDARRFLLQEFPGVDVDALLDHLEACGLDALIGNPLTLRMLGEVAATTDSRLPDTRAELFDRACRVMLEERNPRHDAASHVLKTEDELLLAAGAVCAALLLCDRPGAYAGPTQKTPEGFLNVAELGELRYGKAIDDARRTRLFRAEGENRFAPIHRVIAEYLGAWWLVRCFENGVSERRIFALFQAGDGVPTSLRGLHAWIAHFSEVLSFRCIAADPYAIVRYGDAETLGPDQARALLDALKQLSGSDPYFRSGDWDSHPASALMRVDLRDDICTILDDADRHRQLSVFLLEAIAGAELAHALAPTLQAISYDRDRLYDERKCALLAWRDAHPQLGSEAIIRRLLELKDPDSAQLAFDLLRLIGASALSVDTIADTVLAHLGFAATPEEVWESATVRYVPDRLFRDIDALTLEPLLDRLADGARTLKHGGDWDPKSDLADLVRRLVVQVLSSGAAVEPARLWSWIGWLDRDEGYSDREKEQLAASLRDNHPLRAALMEHVLLEPCAENTSMAGIRLARIEPGLYPTVDDLKGALRALQEKAAGGPIDPETYRHLLFLGCTQDGLPPDLHNAALEIADGDSALLSIADQVSNPPEPEWKIEQERNRAEHEAKRQRIYQSHRDALTERTEEIAVGGIGVLAEPANVYLGRKRIRVRQHASGGRPSTEDVMREFLGEDLAEQVMVGFIAALGRDDLPAASSIADVHSRGKYWPAEAVMICGVEELLRREQPIRAINRDTLAAAYMARQRAPETGRRDGIDIRKPLEEVLFESGADWEDHYRTSIEPQLAADVVHVDELYRLTTDPDLVGLTGRLAVEWLRRYPKLRCSTQKDLLACALDWAEEETLRALILDRQSAVHPDLETRLLWLSADYAVDFERRRDMLLEAAAHEPRFIWFIRDRVAPARRDRSGSGQRKHADRFSLAQFSFIVEAFGRQWPWTEHPSSSWGRENPWDATRFIQYAIETIGGRPCPEATEALQTLIADHAPTYANGMKHMLHLQRRARRDSDYTAPAIGDLRSAVTDGLPESIDQMRAWFADRLEEFRNRLRGTDTNMREAYWNDSGEPRNEEYCRDRLIEHVCEPSQEPVRFGPEMRMPDRKRADIVLTRNAMKLPVEIKGQWEATVWNAVNDQLDALYTVDRQAEGRGVYVVLWFGDIPGRNLPKHPDGLPRPGTPEELEPMLKDRLPEARRASIDIFVIDLSRPAGTA